MQRSGIAFVEIFVAIHDAREVNAMRHPEQVASFVSQRSATTTAITTNPMMILRDTADLPREQYAQRREIAKTI